MSICIYTATNDNGITVYTNITDTEIIVYVFTAICKVQIAQLSHTESNVDLELGIRRYL